MADGLVKPKLVEVPEQGNLELSKVIPIKEKKQRIDTERHFCGLQIEDIEAKSRYEASTDGMLEAINQMQNHTDEDLNNNVYVDPITRLFNNFRGDKYMLAAALNDYVNKVQEDELCSDN